MSAPRQGRRLVRGSAERWRERCGGNRRRSRGTTPGCKSIARIQADNFDARGGHVDPRTPIRERRRCCCPSVDRRDADDSVDGRRLTCCSAASFPAAARTIRPAASTERSCDAPPAPNRATEAKIDHFCTTCARPGHTLHDPPNIRRAIRVEYTTGRIIAPGATRATIPAT